MTDMTKTQKHMLCLEAVVEMKEKIVNDKAVIVSNERYVLCVNG